MNPIIVGALVLAYLLFLRWYGGKGRPLSAQDVDAYMARIGEQQATKLRAFAEADDGREFYNVNLVTLRNKPVYEDGRDFSGTSKEANSLYGRAVLPELFKRASHPILLSSTLGALGAGASKAKWETVNVVRYRSRRDLLDMVASETWQTANAHKVAAIEVTEIYPVAGASTSFIKLLVGMGLLIIGLVINMM